MADTIILIGTPAPTTIVVGRQGVAGVHGTGAALIWTNATSNLTLQVAHGYLANDVTLLSFALPASGSLGDKISVIGYGLGGWKITQRVGEQIIILGSQNATTAGVSGSISSNNVNDAVDLFYITANVWGAILYGGSFN